MSIVSNRSAWNRVRLGDVISRSSAQADPREGRIEAYVGGGHVETDSVIIDRFGDPADGHMGSTFRYTFAPGEVLFVSARPYLRKVGVPNFSGVVADKTYVLSAVPDGGLVHALLPFLLTSDAFVEYANREATGSMNPRLLWGAMQRFEIALPPVEEQARVASLLWAVERHERSLRVCTAAIDRGMRRTFQEQLETSGSPVLLGEVVQVNPEQVRAFDAHRVVRYIDIASVGQDAEGIALRDVSAMAFGEAPGRARRIIRAGDVLVSTVRPALRSVGRVPESLDGALASTGFAVLRPSAEVPSKILWHIVTSDSFTEDMVGKSTGSAYPAVRAKDVASFQLKLPSQSQVAKLSSRMETFEVALEAVAEERLELANLRASLLDDVFGGN